VRARVFLVDAFCDGPGSGNPAGVCPLEAEPDERWMQLVARELNQAETAFLWPEGGAFRLRWLTPTVEVDLCGHATLASAHALWSEGLLAPALPARFATRSGTLVCTPLDDGRIEMDFPEKRPQPSAPLAGLLDVLGSAPRWVGANRMDWFVELADESAVRTLRPDHAAIARLGLRGLIVTARADAGAAHDFVSRFFAPQSGVPEDHVTGSAHCALAPYWCERLGRPVLTGFQASARGGRVEVEPRDGRVLLRGRARTTLAGEWRG
jgi:PhzF family phenazine biosynthesis protein